MSIEVLTRVTFFAALVVLTASSRAQAAQPPSATTVLSQARAAMGGAALDRVASYHARGNIIIAGIKGNYELWCDAKSDAFAESNDAGPFAGADGFDGAATWNQDWSGVVWVDGGKAGRYTAIATAYLMNDDFLRPTRRGVVSLVGRRLDGGSTYDVLKATPPQGLPMEIWFNAKTHLPARFVVTIGTTTITSALSNYHRVNGLQIAFHEHSTSDTGNESDTTITGVDANPPDIAAHLNKPSSRATDYSIAGGSQTTVPIDIIDNHVYVSVTLNGKGPFRFAFDTGGSNLVDNGIAQTIGLTTAGTLQAGGAGTKTEAASFAKVATVGVGQASIADQYFAVLPVKQGFSVAAGVPIDGLIGFEVLSRFITTFDYGHKTLTLRLPSAGAQRVSGADTIPFVFNNTIPQLACQLDGIAGDCSVDTGSRASISVLTPFVTSHPSLVPPASAGVGVNGFGIGGPALGRLGRLSSLRIGNTELKDVVADFSVQKKGYFANPFVAANIGGGVWRRFTITFDYPDLTMSLVPNADFAEREAYDRSGLFLVLANGRPTVLDARSGTPAAQAGIARGDVITAIGGTPVSGFTLAQLRGILSGPAGTTVRLTMQRGGSNRDVSLVLRDYV